MKKAGWFNFCDKLQGYHSQVTMLFIKNYRDEKVQMERLTVRVNEDSIAEAIFVPAQGRNGLNNRISKEISVNF